MTFYWYDYETFGSNVSIDRPAQFAGVRTDENLEEIGEPVVLYCRPAADYLPKPEACLIHGITPLRLLKEGLRESEFAHRILEELSVPDTCAVGYNAMGFDHEITRFLFYRNLRDPYAWHWRNGNSRWDNIDLLRAAYALRPDGIEWPVRDDGAPSFRLEDIAAANGLDHDSPHEALTDVRTTIAVARLIKQKKPKLFKYYLKLTDKRAAAQVLQGPCVFVSSYIAAVRGCATLVGPVCEHPTNPNSVIAYDLHYAPSAFLELSSEELRDRLFSPREPDGPERPPLYGIKLNGCPFVARPEVLDESAAARLGLDVQECMRHFEVLKASPLFASVVQDAYARDSDEMAVDVDAALYVGSFIPDSDRRVLERMLSDDITCAGAAGRTFDDDRMAELVFRYRARNYPDSLTQEEAARWKEHCRSRHAISDGDGLNALDAFASRVKELRRECAEQPDSLKVLAELENYGKKLRQWLS